MKKILLAAVAFVACSVATVSAQSVEWGIKAGLNLSNVTHVDDAKMKPSVNAGVFANFMVIDDILNIQPEVLYSRQGWKLKEGDVDVYGRLNYINIPVLAKLNIIDNLTLDLGPQFGFLLDAKTKAKADGETVKVDIDGAKNFDVSFAMGASYRIIPALDVYARYNLGLTKVFDTDGDKIKNSVIQIGVGFWM